MFLARSVASNKIVVIQRACQWIPENCADGSHEARCSGDVESSGARWPQKCLLSPNTLLNGSTTLWKLQSWLCSSRSSCDMYDMYSRGPTTYNTVLEFSYLHCSLVSTHMHNESMPSKFIAASAILLDCIGTWQAEGTVKARQLLMLPAKMGVIQISCTSMPCGLCFLAICSWLCAAQHFALVFRTAKLTTAAFHQSPTGCHQLQPRDTTSFLPCRSTCLRSPLVSS